MESKFIIQYKIAGLPMYPLSVKVEAECKQDAVIFFRNNHSKDSIIIAINGELYYGR